MKEENFDQPDVMDPLADLEKFSKKHPELCQVDSSTTINPENYYGYSLLQNRI